MFKIVDKKSFLLIHLLTLALVDTAILLDIPVLRQVLTFTYFTIIPGLIILQLLKLTRIRLTKIFVYSVGLSLSFLMISGLIINSFAPIIARPLSLFPILVFINTFIILLLLATIKFGSFNVVSFGKLGIDYKSIQHILFNIQLIILSVMGVYILNTFESNTLVIFLFYLIIVYVVLLTYKKTPQVNVFPLAIFAISLSLSLLFGLRHHNIPVGDISYEYYVFKQTIRHCHWDLKYHESRLNAMLSVTILPTIYSQLLGINGATVFLIVYRLLLAICPLVLYVLYSDFLDKKYAFLASLFAVGQFPFMTELGQMARVEIAYVFFFLSVLVLFDKGINIEKKYILFMIYTTSMILSHYSTTVLVILIFTTSWIINKILFRNNSNLNNNNIPLSLFVTSAVIMFTWYGLVTLIPFRDIVINLNNWLSRLLSAFLEQFISHNPALREKNIPVNLAMPYKITKYIYYSSIILIFIGITKSFIARMKRRESFDDYFLSLSLVSLFILIFSTFASSVYGAYGPERVFYQLIVFLSPMFIGGCIAVARFTLRILTKEESLHLISLIVTILTLLQFLAGTYVIFQMFGVTYAEYFGNGIRYSKFYVHDSDVASISWLNCHNVGLKVWSDFYGRQIYAQVDPRNTREGVYYSKPIKDIRGDYIFFRYENVMTKTVDTKYYGLKYIDFYSILKLKNKIYDGGSQIFK